MLVRSSLRRQPRHGDSERKWQSSWKFKCRGRNGRTRLTDTNRLPQSSMDGKNKNSFQLDSRDPNNQLPSPMTVGFPAMQPTTSSFVVSILLLGGLRDSSRTLSSEHMTIRKRQYWEDALAYFRHKSGKHVITCIKRCKTTKRFVGYPQHRIALVKAPLVCRNPCSLHEL